MDAVNRGEVTRARMASFGCCLLILLATLVSPAAPVAASQNGDAGTPSANGLAAMLEKVPLNLPGVDADALLQVSYADLATQLDATGVERPNSVESPEVKNWIAATTVTPTPSDATRYLSQWRELFGFDLFQADQTLELSGPPFSLTLFQGQFDELAVVEALEQLGYEAVDLDGAAVYAVRGDYEIDLQSDAGFVLATMNVAAILPDGTLVFAPAMEIIEAVVAVAAGDRDSLAESPDVAALLPQLPPDLVGATVVPGAALRQDPVDIGDFVSPDATLDVDAMATEIATPNEMPPVVLAVLGTTAGGSLVSGTSTSELASGQAVVFLLMQGEDAAETAVPAIEQRLESGESRATGRPYAESFTDHDIQAISGEPIVSIELSIGDAPPNILIRMLYQRDLGFIAW